LFINQGTFLPKNCFIISMKFKFIFLVGLFFLVVNVGAQQNTYNTNYFKPPLEIPLVLAGNFGELRPNHFHAGIDFKTNGGEGLKILAAADGFVSRIKISKSGYGNALYLNHPNGYTTVYAHLQVFSETLEAHIKKEQYKTRKSEVDLELSADLFTFKQGDVIALSGNSGSSQAPHLHFEIRETKSEHPINPLLFGYKLADEQSPKVYDVQFYKIENNISTPLFRGAKTLKASKGVFTFEEDILQLPANNIGIAIRTFDTMDAASNQFNVFEIKMDVGGITKYQFTYDELSFDETRYINAHIDFAEKLHQNKSYQRCFTLPGNQLNIYDVADAQGIINLSNNEAQTVTLTLKDFAGNETLCSFKLQKKEAPEFWGTTSCATPMPHNQVNQFANKEIVLQLPEKVLYEDICFDFAKTPAKSDKAILSPVYQLHFKDVPVHTPYEIQIKPNEKIALNIRKAVICYLDNKDREQAHETIWDGTYLKANSKNFGKHYIKFDKEKPKISAKKFARGKSYNRNSNLLFNLTDNLSGIRSYQANLNGQWAIALYDKSKKQLSFKDFSNAKYGRNSLILIAEDMKGNYTQYETYFNFK